MNIELSVPCRFPGTAVDNKILSHTYEKIVCGKSDAAFRLNQEVFRDLSEFDSKLVWSLSVIASQTAIILEL